jgi:hypothetical protein
MRLVAALASGELGVKFVIPKRMRIIEDTAAAATLIDQDRALSWHVSIHEYRLDLRPESQALLDADIERHTRDLFESFFRNRTPAAHAAPDAKPRTADPTWSPVVSVERVRCGKHDALCVIHRMSYAHGDEMIMGHLLVPFRRGTFELRVIARERSATGMRESLILSDYMAGVDDDAMEIVQRLRQRDFDDAKHDVRFPAHPLSRVRAELREVFDADLVTVLEPSPTSPPSEVVLRELECAIVPPARYLLTAQAPSEKCAQFSRISFAGTDGIQLLTLLARRDKQLRPTGTEPALLDAARDLASNVAPEAQNLQIEVHTLPDAGGRTQVMAYRTYDDPSGVGPQHSAFRLFVPEPGRLLIIAIGTGQCVPKEEMLADLESVVASWRPLDGEPSTRGDSAHDKKPWWRIW